MDGLKALQRIYIFDSLFIKLSRVNKKQHFLPNEYSETVLLIPIFCDLGGKRRTHEDA